MGIHERNRQEAREMVEEYADLFAEALIVHDEECPERRLAKLTLRVGGWSPESFLRAWADGAYGD